MTREEPLTPDAVSTVRAMALPQLQRRLEGDLDAICLKALRKAPEERYASVEQFAEDLKRHIHNLPVHACEWTTTYRVRKFVQRHRTGVWATVAVVVVLTLLTSIFTIGLFRERNRARLEAARAEQITAFLNTVFEAPTTGMGGSDVLTAHDLLRRGAVRIEEDLAGQPEVQAALWELIGNVYSNLGHTRDAVDLLERALAQRLALYAPDDPAIISNMAALGKALQAGTRYDEAEQHFREALGRSRAAWGEGDVRTAQQQTHLALLLHLKQQDAEAVVLQRAALAALLDNLEATAPEVAAARQQLAVIVEALGHPEEAEQQMKQVLDAQRAQWPEGHPQLAASLVLQADMAARHQRFSLADSLYHQALAMQRSLLGEEHAEVGMTLNHLAQSQMRQQAFADAEQTLRESLDIHTQTYGRVHPVTIDTRRLLIDVLLPLGKPAEAVALSEQALEEMRAVDQPDEPTLGLVLSDLARSYQAQGQTDRAEAAWRESLTRLRRTLPPEHADLAVPLQGLGTLLRALGNATAAEPLLQEALRISRDAPNVSVLSIATLEAELGRCLLLLKRYEEAEAHLLASHQALAAQTDHPAYRATLEQLVALYEAWGRAEEAGRYREAL